MARKKSKGQSRTTSTVGITLPANVQTGITNVVRARRTKYDWSTQRTRLEKIDKAMQLESDTSKLRTKPKDHGYFEDTTPPVVKPEIDTAHAFYVDMFCSGDPMFKVIETNTNAEAAKMMQAQVLSDEMHYGYSAQVSQFLRDQLKYNIGGLEILWEQEEIFQPMNDLTFSQGDEDKATATIYRGNKLRRIDPYNLFYDMSVPANEVSEKGQFVGYIERMPLTQLHQQLAAWRAAGKAVMNENRKMWESQPQRNSYYVPNVTRTGDNSVDEGWGSFFFPDDTLELIANKRHNVNYSEHYEVTTVYMRIIPAMFGISVAAKERVQVWRFVIVNDNYIVLAERQTNMHNLLPIRIGQMDDDGIWSESKSLAEMLVPFQNQSNQMHDAWLGMIWKAVSDKGIYDSRRISKKDIESKNPTAKIPARPNANNADLRGAYLPIPYDGSAAGIIQTGIDGLGRYTSEISGQNAANRGQFQKGNKTMAEYQDVMSNSDSRKYVKAILLEATVFQPLKNVMKLNILQYAQQTTVQSQGEQVEIKPAEMRKQVLEFRIADGLKNVERIAKTGSVQNALALMAPYAQMAPAYGVDPFLMIMDYMRNMGMPMDNYKPQNLNPELLPRGGAGNAPPEPGTA